MMTGEVAIFRFSIILTAVTLQLFTLALGGAVYAQSSGKPPTSNNTPPPNTAAKHATSRARRETATGTQHVLEGKWLVTWIRRASASQMQISQVRKENGVTVFSGRVAAPIGEEACPLMGSVIDRGSVQYSDDIEQHIVNVSAMVFVRAQCKNHLVLFELLGLPNGAVLMTGRSTVITPSGERSYEPIALSRPK